MNLTKRVTDLEKQAGVGEDLVAETIDDRQEHIDFIRWLRRVQGKDDTGPVEISPELEKTFRPPFTVTRTKADIEETSRVITEWMAEACAGGPRK